MKLKQLKGIWKDTAESYQQSFASDVAGWHYSQYRMGENVEENAQIKSYCGNKRTQSQRQQNTWYGILQTDT